MSGSTGDRKPPRPRIEVIGPASPTEAAAVVAAVERFLADTTPAAARRSPVNPWQRAALLEGVGGKEGFASPWGEPMEWGERLSHKS